MVARSASQWRPRVLLALARPSLSLSHPTLWVQLPRFLQPAETVKTIQSVTLLAHCGPQIIACRLSRLLLHALTSWIAIIANAFPVRIVLEVSRALVASPALKSCQAIIVSARCVTRSAVSDSNKIQTIAANVCLVHALIAYSTWHRRIHTAVS